MTILPLSRLGRRDSVGMLDGITKGKALPNAVVEQVLAHTDGVPLFIEELASTLLESGVLRETPNSHVLDAPLRRSPYRDAAGLVGCAARSAWLGQGSGADRRYHWTGVLP